MNDLIQEYKHKQRTVNKRGRADCEYGKRVQVYVRYCSNNALLNIEKAKVFIFNMLRKSHRKGVCGAPCN